MGTTHWIITNNGASLFLFPIMMISNYLKIACVSLCYTRSTPNATILCACVEDNASNLKDTKNNKKHTEEEQGWHGGSSKRERGRRIEETTKRSAQKSGCKERTTTTTVMSYSSLHERKRRNASDNWMLVCNKWNQFSFSAGCGYCSKKFHCRASIDRVDFRKKRLMPYFSLVMNWLNLY